MNKILLIFVLVQFCCFSIIYSQHVIPILKTTSSELSIRDGDILRQAYWSIDPNAELDIYAADKTSVAKYVTFISDIDSIRFLIQPLDTIDFYVINSSQDVFPTRVQSSITYDPLTHILTPVDSFPFALTSYNNISIKGIFNKKDTLEYMFHSGVNSVGITFDALEKISALDTSKSVSAKGWGGAGEMKYTRGNHLKIGNHQWGDLLVWVSKHSGHFTDGKIGPNLFKDQLIEIDFDAKQMRIYSHLDQIPSLHSYSKYVLSYNGDLMFVSGNLKIGANQYQNTFMIHTGYSGALLLDDGFASQHKIGDQLKITSESQLKDSFGNVLKTKKAILPALDLGGAQFSSIPISFFEGKIGNQKHSVLGGELLKRFNIIFDMQRAELYLKPNRLMALPFPKDEVKG